MNGTRPCRSARPGEATGNDTVAEIAATMEVRGTGNIGTTLTAGRAGRCWELSVIYHGTISDTPRRFGRKIRTARASARSIWLIVTRWFFGDRASRQLRDVLRTFSPRPGIPLSRVVPAGRPFL